MKRKTVVFLLLGLLLSLTLSLSAPSASAHGSSYCGHGHSGWHVPYNTVVHYRSSYWEKSWHFHVYYHYSIGNLGEHSFVHSVHKICQVH
jgi:hypothetical protein